MHAARLSHNLPDGIAVEVRPGELRRQDLPVEELAGDGALAAHLRADGREGSLRVPAAVVEGGGGHFDGDGADVGRGGEGGWVLGLESADAVDGAVGGAHGCVAVKRKLSVSVFRGTI